MRILIALADRGKARRLALHLESWREDWACALASDGVQALAWAWEHQVAILDGVLPRLDGPLVLARLACQKRLAPPLTLMVGGESPWADACLPRRAEAQAYPLALEALAGKVPRLFDQEAGLARARAFLDQLGMGRHLKGYGCLAAMLTAALGNPALVNHVTGVLYPLAARAEETSPAAAERCTRHAIESLWSHGDLNVLEAYFGQSVDPERGKPTNREFLAMALEHCVRLAAREAGGALCKSE